MKKSITLVITAILLAGIAACGKGSGGRVNESGEDHLEISIALWEINTSLPRNREDPIRGLIEDKFNITLKGAGLSWADDVSQLLGVWAATGQLPDVFGGDLCRTAQFRQWVADDVIRSIPQSMYSKYPNIKKAVENDPMIKALMINGELWFLPRAAVLDTRDWFMERGIFNRKDWREKLGFDVPRTKQDFIELCAAYAAMDPKGDGTYTTGLTFNGPQFVLDQVFSTFGQTSFHWIRGDDGLYYVPAFEDSFELVSWLRDMNKAGGIDPDFMNYTAHSAESGLPNFLSGKAGMVCVQATPAMINSMALTFLAANPGVKYDDLLDYFEILEPPVDGGKEPVGLCTASFWSESYISANVSDVKLDRILQLYDWLMSDEGMYLMTMGIEGVDWDHDGSGSFIIHNSRPDQYPLLSGGFMCLASWYGHFQWINPAIPKVIRDYNREIFSYRFENWNRELRDYALILETIPERDALGSLEDFGMNFWAPFIFDKSNAGNRELFDKLKVNMDSAGYRAAKDAVNARARALGIN